MYLLTVISSAINLLCDLKQDLFSLCVLVPLFVKQRSFIINNHQSSFSSRSLSDICDSS